MSFTLVQAGNQLYPINSNGAPGAALVLPAGVTLSTRLVPRFTRINRFLVLVNTPTVPLSIDENGIVRRLTIPGPLAALTLSGPSGGTLTGTYLSVYTYIVKDASGNTISESDYSPVPAAPATITSAFFRVDGIAPSISPSVGGVRLYRTTTGPGAVYFKWKDIDGNTTTGYQDDLADAGLGIVGAPIVGPAPDLTLIKEWQARLWGVDRTDVDHLRYTEAGTMYAWGALNTIPIPHVGDDSAGIIGVVPRRNALGVGRHTSFSQITGTANSNFQCVTVSGGEQASFVSQESCIVRNDVAIFLGMDGVYRWDSSGISSISDGRVRSWFATDQYFNRSMFYRAFAQLDRAGLKYRLFLASAGSNFIDRWVEFDLLTGAWFGPHLTTAFTLTSAVDIAGANGQFFPTIGSQEGFLSIDQEPRNDWTTHTIPLMAQTKAHSQGEPDLEKYWGELSMNGKQQTAGTVVISPLVGDLTALPPLTPFAYDMVNGRQRLPRLGVGKHVSLVMTHDVLNEDVMLYGYEINPVSIVGRR